MSQAIDYLIEQGRQPSTWLGMVKVAAGALGLGLSDQMAGQVALLITVAVGFYDVLRKEKV